jgi:3D (Asp-Asp-Asp) domain-containing protein
MVSRLTPHRPCEVAILPLWLIRLPCLLLLVVLPTSITTGPSHGDDDRLTAILPPDPHLSPSEQRAIAAEPLLALPAGQPVRNPLPPMVGFADVPSLVLMPAPPPLWLSAWHGDTPASRPSQAARFSLEQPDAYAGWLASQLPAGAHVRRLWATVTAYCPCSVCCSIRTERTADGTSTVIHPYGIAADWRELPEGSQVHVPGYLTESTIAGVWPVDDTGGALRRSSEQGGTLHIDVRFVAHRWAARWGVRHQWIYLVESPAPTAVTAAVWTPPPAAAALPLAAAPPPAR